MVENRSREVAVVDDDAAVLDSMQFMLELAGFQVATYGSAVSYLASAPHRARCLILDYNMPLMTGLELMARLRAGGSSIPVLLITSALSDDIVSRAAELGVEQVLGKPPNEDALIGFVNACA